MSPAKQFFDRWKSDYDFKTIAAARGVLAVTIAFALYNGFLGVYHASLWHGTISVYYMVLAALRGFILGARKRAGLRDDPQRAQKKAIVVSAALLLFLNVCLILPVSLMVVRQKPVHMTLIPAIGMATFTTYKIGMASVHLKRRKRSTDSFVRLLRTIGFIEALVSILTLQNTLIMVNMKEESPQMLTVSAITSALILLTVLSLSVAVMKKGIADLKSTE